MIRFLSYITLFLSALVLATITTASPSAAQTNTSNPLAELRKSHPRLFLTPERLQRIRSQAKTDPILAKLVKLTVQDAEKMLNEPVVAYKIPDGKRLLGQSRYAIRRIWTLSLAYRLTEDRRFLDAAVKEMLTAGKFKDWNPPHFLDTAEMTAAIAVGYDWLYDTMDSKDREDICQSIIQLGLKPGLESFKKGHWWTKTGNNWNQVCNGGMILGALAIANEKPDLASQMIDLCLKSIPSGVKSYRPDGAYPEGPGYWVYGTTYSVLTMFAFDSALGYDFGIHKTEGLAPTATYRIQMAGPFGFFFNYADGSAKSSPDFVTFGLAHIYQQPNIAKLHLASMIRYYGLNSEKMRRPKKRFYILNVIYYPENKKMKSSRRSRSLPLDAFFRGKQDIVTMRGKWDDPNTTFLGIKGGDNQTNHGHLDIGSFVLDANGARWATDLGSDNYNMPDYFDRNKKRWTYYRMTNHSHNTLVIGDQLQNIKAVSRVTDFRSTPKATHATIDMSDAYKGQAESVIRKASLLGRHRVVIRDTVIAPTDEVQWQMVTRAHITLDRSNAVLKRGNKQMNVKIVSPKNAQFKILSTQPNTKTENQNHGTRILAFTAKPNGKKPVTLEVIFTPVPQQKL